MNTLPLIARAVQFEALQAALAQARAGTGQSVVLTGEAGIGKTRLLREFRETAAAAGVPVLHGNCYETDSALAFAPLIDALRGFCSPRSPTELAGVLGHLAPELAKLLPELALKMPDVRPPASLAPELEKRRLFETLAQFMSRLAGPGTLLVIIEDVHWADEPSLEFFQLLVRRQAALPILLVLAARPEAQSPALTRFLANVHRERLAQEIRLPPLSAEAVEALLCSMFGWEPPIKRPLLDAIYALTEGNPFFVEEVATTLVASGDIYLAGGRWRHKPLTQLPIPHSLRLIVQQHTAGLNPASAELLALAAVAGQTFDFELLAQLTGFDDARLLALIKELVAARLVVEQQADRFAFRHALTREAITSGLLSRERRRWHQAIAGYYTRQAEAHAAEARLPQLAYHYYEAGQWEPALHYGQAAGAQALGQFAPLAALVHFGRAARAATELGQAMPLESRRQRGQAQQMVGNLEAAQADFEAVLEAARMAGDRHAEWQALYDLGYLWTARDYVRAGEVLQQTLALARTLDDPAALGHSLNRLGNWQANMGRPMEALAQHREALAIFEARQDKRGLAATLDLIGTANGLMGNAAESATHYRRAIPLFEELGDQQGLASSLMMLATVDFAAGEQAVRLAAEAGWRDGEARAHIGLAFGHTFAGSLGAALWHSRRGLDIARDINHLYWQMLAGQVLGAIHWYIFAFAEAEAYLDQVVQLAQASGARMFGETALSLLVLSKVAEGDLAAAAEAASRLALPPVAQGAGNRRYVAWALGELALAQGQPAVALSMVAEIFGAEPQLREWQEHIWPVLRHLEGRALAEAERTDEAIAVLRDALVHMQEQGMRSWQWRCHADLARVYFGRKALDAAETELGRAETLILEIAGTIPDEAMRARFEAGARHYLPRRPELTRLQQSKQLFGGLTRREQQIAALIARGKSNREIAAELFITVRTTKTHVSSILNKLDLRSRTQIAAWFMERQLPGSLTAGES